MSLLLVVPLLVAACGSSSSGGASSSSRTIAVTISDDGCEPSVIHAKAGSMSFTVHNDGSSSVTEFEILKGSKILGEIENVVPGADRSFSVTLEAGNYVTYCPNAKDEKGTLEVSAS
jgi:iron uptake system component EfeO